MNRKSLLLVFFVTQSLAVVPGEAASPSFDCAKAVTKTEHAICASDRLSTLDREMTNAYRDARAGGGASAKKQIRKEQISWIGQRNACGGDTDCIEARMRGRIAALRGETAHRAPAGRLTGTYCARGGDDMIAVEDFNNTIEFDFLSVQRGAHSCSTGRLRAIKSGSGYTAREGGCSFRIVPQAGQLVFSSGNEPGCRNLCGAHASFGKHVFPFTGRRPLPSRWTSVLESGGC
jgi:uncharacterized protein